MIQTWPWCETQDPVTVVGFRIYYTGMDCINILSKLCSPGFRRIIVGCHRSYLDSHRQNVLTSTWVVRNMWFIEAEPIFSFWVNIHFEDSCFWGNFLQGIEMLLDLLLPPQSCVDMSSLQRLWKSLAQNIRFHIHCRQQWTLYQHLFQARFTGVSKKKVSLSKK